MGDASTAHTLQRRGPWAPEERFGAKDEVPIEPDAPIVTPARPLREPLVWLSPSAAVATTREGNGRGLHRDGAACAGATAGGQASSADERSGHRISAVAPAAGADDGS